MRGLREESQSDIGNQTLCVVSSIHLWNKWAYHAIYSAALTLMSVDIPAAVRAGS